MFNKFKAVINDVLGAETPREEDNEESKINWLIDEFDFRNNNDELVQGVDLIKRHSSTRKSSNYSSPGMKRKMRIKKDTPMEESSSGSFSGTSSSYEDSSDT